MPEKAKAKPFSKIVLEGNFLNLIKGSKKSVTYKGNFWNVRSVLK